MDENKNPLKTRHISRLQDLPIKILDLNKVNFAHVDPIT